MLLLLLPLTLFTTPKAVAHGHIVVDATKTGARIPRSLYGVFLEEINNAGEGGLYAELIQNRGFEDANLPPACTLQGDQLTTPKKPSFWEGYSKDWTMPWPYAGQGETPAWSISGATMRVVTDHPLTPASPHAVEIDAQPGAALVNEGFWGMGIVKGAKYNLFLFAQPLTYRGALKAELIGQDGQILAQAPVKVGPTDKWTKLTATLNATKTDPKAKFALVTEGTGKLLVDFVSLMPAKTWKNHGLRPDLAQMIADLKPGFVRWPGGCVAEGITIETRPQWQQTLGPLEARAPTFVPWGYWVSNGFGYHEWLQFCEDIGADPLYVFNAGISCAFRSGTYLPDSDLPGLIQNTLDAIEYAVGPVTTPYGAMRAKAGHPKPFGMHMVEVGNEDQGAKYGKRFATITAAIKAKYPQIKVALSSWIGGIDHAAIDAAGPNLNIVDEHAYRPINWSVQNFDSFAKYPRTVPWELYVGEFATNSGVGRGNMAATIGDSAYMMSMEKNADLVKMGSYAPLLENINRREWEVNLIHFDSSRAFGRASYYACQLFAQNRPDVNLPTTASFTATGESPIVGPIGLGTYGNSAEFKDVKVDGQPISQSWHVRDGNWQVKDGLYTQADPEGFDNWGFFGNDFHDTTLTLKARKIAGREGFAVSVGNADGRRVQFNVGGWGNSQHGLEAEGVIRQVRGHVETGRWYDVKVETRGRNVKAYLDGKLIFDETLPRIDTLLSIAGRDEKTGEIVVKVLNTGSAAADVDLDIKGARLTGGNVLQLASDDPRAENSFGSPEKIAPKSASLQTEQSALKHRFPPYSLSILRLKTR